MKRLILLGLLLVGCLSLVSALAAAPPTPAARTAARPYPIWNVETAVPGGPPLDLALAGSGMPHVVYLDADAGQLRHTRLQAEDWRTESVVELAAAVDLTVAIAVGPDGSPLIAYNDIGNDSLIMALQTTLGWVPWRIAPYGRLVSMLIDDAGQPHVAYVAGQHVTYLTNDGTGWTAETVGAADPYVWNLWLALDGAGQPHLAYTGGNGSYHAVRSSGRDGWSVESLPLTNIEGFALDDDDQPLYLITEARSEPGHPPVTVVTLLLAQPIGDAWAMTPLDEGLNWGVDARLRAGAGEVVVAYHDAAGRLVVRSRAGGVWRTEYPAAGVGQGIGLALDGTSRPRIVDSAAGEIRYAARAWMNVDHDLYLPLSVR